MTNDLLMSANEWRDELEQLLKESGSLLRRDELLASHTSFGIGGRAEALVVVHDEQGLKRVRRFCEERSLPAVILGKGTNVLVSDQGLRGLVVKLAGRFELIKVKGNKICAGSAALLDDIAEIAEANGLAGADFLAGIPGTIGGGLLTNAGAFGRNLASLIEKVEVLDRQGNIVILGKTELRNEYRQPVIPSELWALRTFLLLAPGKGRSVKSVREERWSKHPHERSAGSFFRNPPDIPAGRLIEQCGLKGLVIGDAAVSEVHANFLINKGAARFTDVYELAQVVKAEVEEKTGIELKEEVRFLPSLFPVVRNYEPGTMNQRRGYG